jgi:PAS domain S-box-containing protein
MRFFKPEAGIAELLGRSVRPGARSAKAPEAKPLLHGHSPWLRYGVVAGVLALATALTVSSPALLERERFTLFYAATLVAMLYGGLGPGLLTVALSVVITNLIFEPPGLTLSFSQHAAEQALAFCVVAGAVVVLIQMLQRSNAALREREARLMHAEQRAEAALRAARERLLNLVHTAQVGIIFCTSSGRILDVNPALQRLLGYTTEELRAQELGWVGLTPPEYDYLSQRALDQLRRQGFCLPYEKEYLHKSGERVQVIVSSARLDPDRDEYVVFVVDISKRKQVEQQLRERETMLRTLGDNLPNGVLFQYVIERGGHHYFNYMSAGIEELIGLRAWDITADADVLLRTFLPEDMERMRRAAVVSMRTLGLFEMEARQRLPSGEVRWVHFRSRPRRLASGATLWDGVHFDVTQRKRAEQALRDSEERYRATVHHAPVGISQTALDGTLMNVNPRYGEILGYPQGDLPGVRFQELTHPDDVARNVELYERLQRGDLPSYQMEKRYLRKDGSVVWTELTGAMARDADGRPQYGIGVIQDITERKQAQQALQLAQAALEQADRRKDEFLAMLAHELRSPLAPLRNAAHIMAILSSEDSNLRNTSEMIERQVRHMSRLIDDLLDVSRITQGKITLQRQTIELAPVLANAVEAVRPYIEARRHELEILVPLTAIRMQADATRLSQVVGNLLHNASKFTPDGGHITLQAEAAPGQAIIRVRDDGIGMGQELLPHVFGLFTQAERTLDRAQGGLGIGLSLVKSLVELHGGSVEATSAGLGRGSEFIVRLPAQERQPAAAAYSAPLGQDSLSRQGIMVVDDNRDAALSMAALLQLEGHRTETAYTGAMAIERAALLQPDVVLLDIGLPGMDGYKVAQQLRAMPQTAHALLIAVTGYGQEEDRNRSRAAGFDAHLVKPVDPADIKKLMAERLGAQAWKGHGGPGE